MTDLIDRYEALRRFVRIATPYVPDPAAAGIDPEVLPAAGDLADRAIARLRFSGGHTVVALAGATGGGKSSLFNALARMQLSPSGHLRPTTAHAHACVWNPGGAESLLDWLGVAPERRFARESLLDAEDEASLRGLVLLDLPDMDSIATGHRIEADRLVDVVDLVVWVLDPQKYADQTVHEDYLRHMGALRDVTVVVFNQTDRLSPADTERCLADLTRLVAADGLAGVPIIPTSAVTWRGVEEVRTLLEKTVSARQAVLARLDGEIDAAVEELSPLVGPEISEDPIDRGAIEDLAGEFGSAVGIPAVTAQAAGEYKRRAGLPLGRSLPRGDVPPAEPTAVAAAVRRFAASAAAGLPAPWPAQVRTAALTRLDQLPTELAAAANAAHPPRRTAIGWWVVRAVWWLAAAIALVGAGWLIWSTVHGPDAPAVDLPYLGERSWPLVLLIGGAALALLILLIGRPTAALGARRRQAKVQRRLRDAMLSVAREVVGPCRTVLRDYSQAREALRAAA
jgi:GTP-binding protein EngB required for normal cell division